MAVHVGVLRHKGGRDGAAVAVPQQEEGRGAALEVKRPRARRAQVHQQRLQHAGVVLVVQHHVLPELGVRLAGVVEQQHLEALQGGGQVLEQQLVPLVRVKHVVHHHHVEEGGARPAAPQHAVRDLGARIEPVGAQQHIFVRHRLGCATAAAAAATATAVHRCACAHPQPPAMWPARHRSCCGCQPRRPRAAGAASCGRGCARAGAATQLCRCC